MSLDKEYKVIVKKRALALFFVFFNVFSFAQSLTNIVNNYSFEDTIHCPTNGGAVNFSNHWFNPTNPSSSDYFNTCCTSNTASIPSCSVVSIPFNRFGFQFPRTGNAYCGFEVYTSNPSNYRENIKNRLKRTLISNKIYCITYYISLAEVSRFISSNIAAYFSNDSIINGSNFPPSLIAASPAIEPTTMISDTINWTRIQGTYTATGIENFVTFGNFKNDASTTKSQIKPLINLPSNDFAYYYIDDVSVVEINSSNAATKDTLYSKCILDSKVLGTDSTEFATYTWQSTAAGLAALSCTDCPNPIANPSVTTKYYLTKQQCSATTKDSVLIIVKTPTTTAKAGLDTTICLGDSYKIGTNDSTSFTTYMWFPSNDLSCSGCAQPVASPTATTIYNLQRQECSLVSNDAVKITIDDCDPTYFVPNIFTPNYDGVNDTWGVMFSHSKYIKNFKLNVYDRWGLLVFSSEPGGSQPNIRWDGHTTSGEACSEGVYFYITSFEKNDEKINLKGHLSLYR